VRPGDARRPLISENAVYSLFAPGNLRSARIDSSIVKLFFSVGMRGATLIEQNPTKEEVLEFGRKIINGVGELNY
jgi:hypothetical protein